MTGMPVQRDDDLGDVLGVDLLFQHALVGLERRRAWRVAVGDVGLDRGDLAVADRGGGAEITVTLETLGVATALLELDPSACG